MKKIVFVLVAWLLSLCFCENATAQVYYSIDGGYTSDKTKFKITTDNGRVIKNNYNYGGYYVGAALHTRYFSPCVQFRSQKLLKEDAPYHLDDYPLERQRFIDIPLMFDYDFVFDQHRSNLSIRLTLMPSVNVSENFDPSYMKRVDLDLLAGVTFDFICFSLDVGSRIGLLDMDKRSNIKSNSLGFYVGLTMALPTLRVLFDDDYADNYMERLENRSKPFMLGFKLSNPQGY